MSRMAIALCALTLLLPLRAAQGQTLNARRTAMGGVLLPGGGPGSDGPNVAYRAVPRPPANSVILPLPIGLIPLISDPPVVDPNDPDFNLYELANLAYNPPWNLQLTTPDTPSNDVVVELGRNHLTVQLGDLAGLFPADHSRLGATAPLPTLGFGVHGFFTGISAIVDYQNDLSMNSPLHAVLADGEPFQTNTGYALFDDAYGQTAGTLQLGWAGGLIGSYDPERGTGSRLYLGVRGNLLRGIGYADARNVVDFTTQDTLFSSSPVDFGYVGNIRTAGPSGGGWGRGVDVGMAWVSPRAELGVGVNNLGARIDWRVEESLAQRDSATGDVNRQVIAEGVPYTSTLPITGVANLALHLGRTTLAADVTRSRNDTVAHLGSEVWFGWLALRSGASIDENRQAQGAGGLGFRLGPLGLDLAIATQSRNLARDRTLELGAGFSLYR